ncbi:Carboxylesterase family-domain-containing protein [Globomyces pollinis-pini]|nr:Carboxylesterase family-domain-containing protein [Globomyces pollinis-pini]
MELNRTSNIVDFTSISTKLPTIVFIHGGSFQTGSGSLNALDGEILAKSLNSIVITINYRLSLFGFPGSDIGDSTSFNVGILDQRMALQWIYKNIETFGGINNQISLMGQSAGATSVIIHAFQPPLNSWIRNIILMSPPAMPFRSIAQGKQDFIDLANILKCIIPASNEITTDVINCLKTKSMRQLLDADELLRKNRNHGMASLDNWLIPIVDGVQIIDHPMLLMQKQNQKLNILYGTVSNETTWIIESAIPLSLPVQSSTLIINALFGESNSPQIKDVYDFKSLTTDTNYRDTISDMLSDMLFVCPNHRFLNYEFSNVFNYYWERPWSGGANEPLGKICKDTACHTTDLVYLFNDPESDASFNRSVAFRKFIKQFIRTGDPSIPDYKWDRSTLNSSVITRFTNDKLIGSFEKSVIHPRKQQCDYWNSQPYSFEKQYLQPTPIVYNGINSIWIVIAITIIIIIFAFQSIFLISMKFHRNQLIFNIGRIQSSNSSIDHDANQLEAMSILLDFVPNKMALTVKGLNYQIVLDNNEMKPILKNCSFQCLPYTMTALLGPSGAGKTSLLSLVF